MQTHTAVGAVPNGVSATFFRIKRAVTGETNVDKSLVCRIRFERISALGTKGAKSVDDGFLASGAARDNKEVKATDEARDQRNAET